MNRSVERRQFGAIGTIPGEILVGHHYTHPVRGPVRCPAAPLVAAQARNGPRPSADRASLERLTPRQREILQLIAERHSTKEIAQILGISVKTVETHRAQLMDRLTIHDVPGLVRFAIRTGLVSLEE